MTRQAKVGKKHFNNFQLFLSKTYYSHAGSKAVNFSQTLLEIFLVGINKLFLIALIVTMVY